MFSLTLCFVCIAPTLERRPEQTSLYEQLLGRKTLLVRLLHLKLGFSLAQEYSGVHTGAARDQTPNLVISR